MAKKAIQDYFRGDHAHCMGCGPQNPDGYRIKTFWDGRQGSYRFTPRSHQLAFPGVFYGGMIAAIIDCHCIGTAIAAAYDKEGRLPDTLPAIMFVTANLNIDYLKPTPMDRELLMLSEIKRQSGRKSVVTCRLSTVAADQPFVQGQLVAVRVA